MRTSNLPLFLLFTACNGAVFGDGHLQSESRTVSVFRSVSIASGFQALVTVGDPAITVRADENLLPLIETFVDGNSLVVRVQPDTVVMGVTGLEVAVSNPVVEGIDGSGGAVINATATAAQSFTVSAAGGSQVHVEGVSAVDLDAQANGGSGVTLLGSATHATTSAQGGSGLHLKGLSLETLALDASGGSTIEATVTDNVTGSAEGGSTVDIAGNPTVDVQSSGGASVKASR
jgi:hypothetical protein